jgi:hypothetical protein
VFRGRFQQDRHGSSFVHEDSDVALRLGQRQGALEGHKRSRHVALRMVSVEVQRSRRRVVTRDVERFAAWLAATFPAAEPSPVAGRPAQNIARAGQSKTGIATHDVQPLILRWFSPDPTSPWAELTRRCGIIGVTTDHIAALDVPERCTLLTVENWEPFLALSYAPRDHTIVAVFTGGNIADRSLQALGTMEPAPTQAIHFGDYDWSGLKIFRRIQAMLPMIGLYVPNDIDDLFRRFAHAARLLNGQQPLTPHPRDSVQVQQVIDLIATSNTGLEQEVVPAPHL